MEQAVILTLILTILSMMALALFVGSSLHDRMYIIPWMWTKYSLIFLQIIRFIYLVIELAGSEKNPTGVSPIFELLFLGKNENGNSWKYFSFRLLSNLIKNEIW